MVSEVSINALLDPEAVLELYLLELETVLGNDATPKATCHFDQVVGTRLLAERAARVPLVGDFHIQTAVEGLKVDANAGGVWGLVVALEPGLRISMLALITPI